jgi:hypothetical protein
MLMASRYLLSNHSGPFIDRSVAHLDTSIVAATYLGFRCFDRDVGETDVVNFVFHGDLLLLEYIHSSWVKHVFEAYRYSQDLSRLNYLSTLLRQNVVKKHFTQVAFQPPKGASPVNSGKDISLPTDDSGNMPTTIRNGLLKIVEYRADLQQKLGSSEGEESALNLLVWTI